MSGLGSEAKRWLVRANQLEEDLKNLIGNVQIAAGCIAYLGPFTWTYRESMIKSWVKLCKEKGIPISDDFSLDRILIEEVQLREW